MKGYITYLKFDNCSTDELIQSYKEDLLNKRKKVTITPNLDGLRICYKNKKIRNLINEKSDYTTIDGKPLIWLSKFNKNECFNYKISGSDLTFDLLKLANKLSLSLALFGGTEDTLTKASENIKKNYPNIKIVLTLSPIFGYEKDEELCKEYAQRLNASDANIFLLCTGFPKTELFYFDYYDLLGPGLYFCVGATIDFLAGTIKRSPKWMSNVGLERAYRLSKDFKRLFKRYWFDFWFLIKIIFVMIFKKKKINNLK